MKAFVPAALSCLLAAFSAIGGESSMIRPGLFTPLKNDEHPCVAENLKESHRYICDDEANVICLSGWREPADAERHSLHTPCPEPVCDYENKTCLHGDCVRPNVCACKVGWEGHLCDRCVPLPGCDQGSCSNAFECNCLENEEGVQLWEGAFCNRPACPEELCNPKNGQCFEPLECTCTKGWTGPNCQICEKLPGCLNGGCVAGNRPNTCECNSGWTGHLCDEPVCREGCHQENGYCNAPDTCLCKAGWEGATCEKCVGYWECPAGGSCVEPNQCVCPAGVTDDAHCNKEFINGPRYEEFSECSNPCKRNVDIETNLNIGEGEKLSKCRWNESGDLSPRKERCYGDRDWVIKASGVSDPKSCVFVPKEA